MNFAIKTPYSMEDISYKFKLFHFFVVQQKHIHLIDRVYGTWDIVHMRRFRNILYARHHGVEDDFDGSEIQKRCEKVRITPLDDFDIFHELQCLDISTHSHLIDKIYLPRDNQNIIHLQIYHTSSIIGDEQNLYEKWDNIKIWAGARILFGNKYEVSYLEKSNDDTEKITQSHPIEKPSKNNISLAQYSLSLINIDNIILFSMDFMEMK